MDANTLDNPLLIERVRPVIRYRTATVDGLEIFYRAAGEPDRPTILLLHGFPTSSHMFRELIPRLADDFYVIAPDYPGFGDSAMPTRDEFDYTFDNIATVMDGLIAEIGLERYSLYMMDYGAPVGFRIATRAPERVETLVIQNGNAYAEGLGEFWDPFRAYWQSGSEANREALRGVLSLASTKLQYLAGTRNPEGISPDNWNIDQPRLDRPGNDEIQLDLFYDYRTNVDLYLKWQDYLRQRQPPTLVVWGRNDPIFALDGALAFLADLDDIELHLLNTGHFALEEDNDFIADRIRALVRSRSA